MNNMNEIAILFDDIERILSRDGKTIADLAKDLGRNYNQVYDWVKLRKFNPRAGALIQLQNWRDKHFPRSRRVSAGVS
jgi:transposase-like protein